MEGRHSVRKNFRFTDAEAAALARHAAAAELTESEYVRALVRNPRRMFATKTETLHAVYRELKRQGVNLNQIAFLANSRRQDDIDVKRLDEWAQNNASTIARLCTCLDEIDEGRRG